MQATGRRDRTSGAWPRAHVPVSESVRRRVAQGEAELVCAHLASDPSERFVHGHLAALRFAAAVVDGHGRPRGRSAPRSVWDMLGSLEPGLAQWAAFFAAGARERAAVETGREPRISDARADEVVAGAEEFREVVAEVLGGAAPAAQAS